MLSESGIIGTLCQFSPTLTRYRLASMRFSASVAPAIARVFSNTINPLERVAAMAIKNLAISNDLNYFDITVKPKTINFNNQQGDIEINIDLLKQIINS